MDYLDLLKYLFVLALFLEFWGCLQVVRNSKIEGTAFLLSLGFGSPGGVTFSFLKMLATHN